MFKKNKIFVPILLSVLLIAIFAGTLSYYFSQRQKPVDSVAQYLEAVRNLDRKEMSTLLQSSDMTLLDSTDLYNEFSESFYLKMASRMQYRITGKRFNLQSDTAAITAHIRYVDLSGIYQDTVADLLSESMDTALSSASSDIAFDPELVISRMEKKAEELGISYVEMDIVYPLIRENNDWKIVALDNETVRVMCSNIPSLQPGISDLGIESEEPAAEQDDSIDSTDAAGTFDLTVDNYSIHYVKHEFSTDFGGDPCLYLYYEYTNTGTIPSSALVDVTLKVYQHGSHCGTAIPASLKLTGNYIQEVDPGETLLIVQAYSLIDDAPVTVHAEELEGLGALTVHAQVLHKEASSEE